MKKSKQKVYRRGAVWAFFAVAVVSVLWAVVSTKEVPLTPERLALRTPSPIYLYGFGTHQFHVDRDTVASGETLGGLLHDLGMPYPRVDALIAQAGSAFRPSSWRAQETYIVVRKKDAEKTLAYLIYEESPTRYVLFGCGDSLYAKAVERPVITKVREVAAVIEGSLFGTLQSQNVSAAVAVRLAEVYAYTIDFFRVQPGDKFKVIFEERFVDDTVSVGAGRIQAALFEQGGKPIYALYFQDSTTDFSGYFDRGGNGLKKMFLKAPLDFFRITSKYTMNRFHPVQRRWKAHLGTDYAAPTGTPILVTAHGVVEKAGYNSGNGNFVKVRHNSTYSTQYLHMSRIASGMRPGTRVSQGQVIGYVGSTGLASGPHVCYRFWVNGRQVNPLALKLPNSEPIPGRYRAAFDRESKPLLQRLDALKYPAASKD
jgi:murein DD-endopeptidase MepM/ murein hydrolase activator NlpD